MASIRASGPHSGSSHLQAIPADSDITLFEIAEAVSLRHSVDTESTGFILVLRVYLESLVAGL